MSATNQTTHYELPVFIGTDKPAWLVDWNGAMNAIDSAIYTVEGKANQAGTDIGSLQSSVSTLSDTVSSINSAVAQLRLDTNANTGSINTINELIGNGTPTTTDHTLIGAINEINAKVYDMDLDNKAVTVSTTHGTIKESDTDISALVNNDSSVGKVYGNVAFETITSDIPADSALFTITVTGLNVTEAFDVKGYLIQLYSTGTTNATGYLHFNVGNTIEVRPLRALSASTYTGIWMNLPPCLLFLKDLGD